MLQIWYILYYIFLLKPVITTIPPCIGVYDYIKKNWEKITSRTLCQEKFTQGTILSLYMQKVEVETFLKSNIGSSGFI